MRRNRAMYLLPAVAFVAAFAYVLIYLYRWEWHRALVAAVFMLAAEILIGFALVLDRLRSIEAKIAEVERTTDATDTTRTILRETAPEPAEPFAWLSEASNRMSVFVPILLGAGVVLSALAWAIERLARMTSSAHLERSLALRLQPLTVSSGTLLGAAPRTLPPLPYARQPRSWRWPIYVIVAALLAVPAGWAFDSVMDATKNRGDVKDLPERGWIVVNLENRRAPTRTVAAAESLWGACANQIGARYRLVGIQQRGPDTVEFEVRPAIGKYAERRLRGCFEDATIDLLRAEVVEIYS